MKRREAIQLEEEFKAHLSDQSMIEAMHEQDITKTTQKPLNDEL